jgi:hypothetical protein
MRKKVVILCLIGSLLIIADSINFAEMIMMFLFNGIIPGTNLSISPTIMLLLMFAAGFVVISKAKIELNFKNYDEIKKVAKQTTTSRRKLNHA